ncbi:MAG: lipoyl(octanoyl) transferase LipB [Clostridiales bacterium]
MSKVDIIDLGYKDYQEALDIQEKLFTERSLGKIKNTILFVEHPPVITVGIRGKKTNILLDRNYLEKHNIKIYDIKRGGDVTYHGPGQLVGYFIFDLKDYNRDVKRFIFNIEEIFIRILKKLFNINAVREDGKYTGIWVDNKKITAIGVQIRKYITMHGFAFNINTNLDHFKWIVPCGIEDRGVTSLENIILKRTDFEFIKMEIVKEVKDIF